MGTIWLAAHSDKRLKRRQIIETNVQASVDSITNPKAPLSLRLSTQLLFGVARVYSRQVGYLLADFHHYLDKIRKASNGAVIVGTTLAEGMMQVDLNAITLPDNYGFERLDELDNGYPLSQSGQSGSLLHVAEVSVAPSVSIIEDSTLHSLAPAYNSGPEVFEMPDVELPFDIEAEMEITHQQIFSQGNSVCSPAVNTTEVGSAPVDAMDGQEELQQVEDCCPEALTDMERMDVDAGPSGPTELEMLQLDAETPGPSPHVVEQERGTGSTIIEKPNIPEGNMLLKFDVNRNRPLTEVPGRLIRKLLMDRSPLLCKRGTAMGGQDRTKKIDLTSFDPSTNALHQSAALGQELVPELAGLFEISPMHISLQEQPQRWQGGDETGRSTLLDDEHDIKDRGAPLNETEAPGPSGRDRWEGASPSGRDGGGIDARPSEMPDLLANEDAAWDPNIDLAPAGPVDCDMNVGPTPMPDSVCPTSPFPLSLPTTPPSWPCGAMTQGTDTTPGDDPIAQDFTARTRAVLGYVTKALKPAESPPTKRQRLSNGSSQQTSSCSKRLDLKTVVEGKPRSYASSVFLELLVLKSKGLVELEQAEALTDIHITAGPSLGKDACAEGA
eukprot:evm.model.scf_21EXC.17 EVM.evm.TU.scf_21EXC.17   scf_21EXC:168927-175360(-)